MKFYIGSSFANKDLVRYVSDRLEQKGFIQTYDWTRNERPATVKDLQHIGQNEKDAITDSNVVIIILPGGKGSHVELGIALGLGKRIILYSPNGEVHDFANTTTFYHLPEVEKCSGSTEELLEYVLESRIYSPNE
ncbi:nucleoside 2-deoxyribosyltransferase [Rossellomorea sp. SC111]|uniref:nucleoside 2-deoxyribosyltransferase n=1 Tax=Rossellomorea sp. SC111 TaxID=2968985 RepID=UPI00215A1899|nr:nucleoside 2-deoxyribosyltransferase [Rossellomorea sp. SC111]MCR8847530.1 nucleoside 2-deoxyribosyltransferase [Rossellomorea sp. SC111]